LSQAAKNRMPVAPTTRLALALALLGFAISFIAASRPLLGDNKNYGLVAESLLRDGDIRLDEFAGKLTGNTREEGGHLYNYFPLGPSLLMTPLVALVRPFVSEPSRADDLAARSTAALCFGVALALIVLVAQRFTGVTPRGAALLAGVFGFCSSQFSAHVGQLSSHATTVPFVLGAFLAIAGTEARRPGLAAALLVVAYVLRPTTGLLLPLTAGWLFVYRRPATLRFVLVAALLGVGVLAMNLAFYGHVLPPYSELKRLEPLGFPLGAAGNLLSPSRGLVFFVPWCVFSALGAVRAFRDPKCDPFFRLLAVAIVAHFAVISCFPQWWGGWCYGPRFLAETMPEFALLLIPALPELFGAELPAQPRRRNVFFTLAAYSLAVAILGITRPAGDWNRRPVNVDQHPERLWDWSDPQILRPLRGPAHARAS
jgi:hypothetical protein